MSFEKTVDGDSTKTPYDRGEDKNGNSKVTMVNGANIGTSSDRPGKVLRMTGTNAVADAGYFKGHHIKYVLWCHSYGSCRLKFLFSLFYELYICCSLMTQISPNIRSKKAFFVLTQGYIVLLLKLKNLILLYDFTFCKESLSFVTVLTKVT